MPYHRRIGNMETLVLKIQDNKSDQPGNRVVTDMKPIILYQPGNKVVLDMKPIILYQPGNKVVPDLKPIILY